MKSPGIEEITFENLPTECGGTFVAPTAVAPNQLMTATQIENARADLLDEMPEFWAVTINSLCDTAAAKVPAAPAQPVDGLVERLRKVADYTLEGWRYPNAKAVVLEAAAALERQAGGVVASHIDIKDYETDEWACIAGVRRFSHAMLAKLNAKRVEGRGGWNKPAECSVNDLDDMLGDHIRKGDPLDIANFCMMIWNRQHPTYSVPAHPSRSGGEG